ncbi:MAG: sigma-70 family RNA polymerase sigma factor [Planctomycetota bacterium]
MPEGRPEPSTDAIRRASTGDETAVGQLLAAYLARLRAFIRLRCTAAVRDHDSVSDLVQSVCREILVRESRLSFATEPEFRAYLFTTALNKVRMRARELGAQRRDVARELPPEAHEVFAIEARMSSPSQVAQAHELAAAVERAFDALPELEREVLALARVVGLPTATIAAQVGRAESSVRQILSRALVKLSRQLDRPVA